MAITIVGSPAGISYRTKCLPKLQAERFAKCLAANPRFIDVDITQSLKAKSERCWFVTYRPVSEARQAAMVAMQQESREERALAEGANYVWCLDKDGGRPFYWLMGASGEVYEVDGQGRSCSCPDFVYRCAALKGTRNGLECKHITALRHGLGTVEEFRAGGCPQSGPTEPEPVPCERCGEPLPTPWAPDGAGCPCEYRDYVPGEELERLEHLRRQAEGADRRCRSEWGAANASPGCWR